MWDEVGALLCSQARLRLAGFLRGQFTGASSAPFTQGRGAGERASALETVEIGATITREATAADATRVRVRREGRTLIPYYERLIDRTSLQVSGCWATSYGLFHCLMLVSLSR